MTHGRVMPTVSHSWNASWPIACVGTWPVRTTIGIESMYAVAMPVTALVTPGPGRDQRDADLVRRARIAVGRVHGALLVPHEDVLDLVLLEELVVDVEDRAARIAEDVLDAFFLEAADDDFGTRELHGKSLCLDDDVNVCPAHARRVVPGRCKPPGDAPNGLRRAP